MRTYRGVRAFAFSLIELMVVIAIVGTLAAIAVPAYKDYVIRAKTSGAIRLLDATASSLNTYLYTNGKFPLSIEFNGHVINYADDWVNVSIADIKYLKYDIIGNKARLLVLLSGLEGIPNYIAPTDSNPFEANFNSLALVLVDEGSNPAKLYCGSHAQAGDGYFIPLKYLPSACRCYGLGNLFLLDSMAELSCDN